LQAIHGDELMPVAVDMPDDVLILHEALTRLREHKKGEPLTLYLKNCGTALRFLEVHIAKYYPNEPITLTGDKRLMERRGKPTSQTNSARLMHGIEVDDSSPYVEMTRRMIAAYPDVSIERDWSSAAFWYEYVAIHGGELLLEGLSPNSLQGDRVVADIYAEHFGVQTIFTPEGALLQHSNPIGLRPTLQHNKSQRLSLDFERIPDLYPAIALTCERLGITLEATGTERLRYKESDRLEAVRQHEVRNDHRMAMALIAADFIRPLPSSPDGQEIIQCIAKSYPHFYDQFNTIPHIVPIRGVNDDGKGKKYALSKLIHASTSEYLWLHDDDIIWPGASYLQFGNKPFPHDLIILPLQMKSESESPSLLERLQIAEYAAIQELTMRTAKAGRAVMCSGANLIVRREAWLECESELHPEIPSGDDMFLLEAMKRHGYRIGVIDTPDYTAIVRPKTTWRAFVRQRMRWAGKAPRYTDPDILRCGAFVLIANIAQFLCPPLLLIKFPFEYSLIRQRIVMNSWRGSRINLFFVALLLELLYPYYLLLSLLGGLFRKSW